MTAGPLADVTVLDFTQLLSGPFCTKLLADFGAEVIKVERPGRGDPARLMGPFADGERHPEKSALFGLLNLNKRSLTLDLATEGGVHIARELARQADIVVESFRPGVMARLGLDYTTLSELNPQLTMTAITNFGQSGPYRDYALSEIVLYGLAGILQANGHPSREPIKMGATFSLHQAGYMAAVATLGAFLGARYQSIPQYVDFAIIESEAGSMAHRLPFMTTYQYTGYIAQRQRTAQGGFPAGYYPCADGFFSVSGGRRTFGRIAAMLDRPELATDPRFSTVAAQSDPLAREQFESEFWFPWIMARGKQEILTTAQEHGVLCGAVNTPLDTLNDPHFAYRQYFEEVAHPVAGTQRLPGAPFKMDRTPYQVRRPAPLLGQHTAEVLEERLGYTAAQVTALRAKGVV